MQWRMLLGLTLMTIASFHFINRVSAVTLEADTWIYPNSSNLTTYYNISDSSLCDNFTVNGSHVVFEHTTERAVFNTSSGNNITPYQLQNTLGVPTVITPINLSVAAVAAAAPTDDVGGRVQQPVELYAVSVWPQNISLYKEAGEPLETKLRYWITNTGTADILLDLIPSHPDISRLDNVEIAANESKVVVLNVSIPAEVMWDSTKMTVDMVAQDVTKETSFIKAKVVEIPSWFASIVYGIADTLSSPNFDDTTENYVKAYTIPVMGLPRGLWVFVPLGVALYLIHKRQIRVRKYELGTKFYVAVILLAAVLMPFLPF